MIKEILLVIKLPQTLKELMSQKTFNNISHYLQKLLQQKKELINS
jgi:hypothetical protein